MTLLPARSIAEAHLYMDLEPCPSCGFRGFRGEQQLVLVGDEMCSQYAGPCERCGQQRQFTFVVKENSALFVELPTVFGGDEPSRLIDPGQWVLVADQALASDRPRQEALELAAAATEEALKFVPAEADEVPAEAFTSDDGRALHRRNPERFSRYALTSTAADYHLQLLD